MELKKIAKRNERREKRVSNDKKRPKVSQFLTLGLHVGTKMKHSPKADDFCWATMKPTRNIQSGHMMTCWKGESLNYNAKIVSDLF